MKAKGSRNEHKAMRILQAAGYHVTRAAGSLRHVRRHRDHAQGMRLIQVKSNRAASPQVREAIQFFGGLPANTTKEVWILIAGRHVPFLHLSVISVPLESRIRQPAVCYAAIVEIHSRDQGRTLRGTCQCRRSRF